MPNENKQNNTWAAVYRILNIAVIVMILARWFTSYDLGLYIVLLFAAIFVVGLLDSLDHNTLRQNRARHIFDFVLLALFALLEFGLR